MTLINNTLDTLGRIINNNYLLAPFIALLAGTIASFSPCNLSSMPLIIGYISKNNKKNTLLLSIIFAIGSSISFIILGILASVFNTGFIIIGDWWYVVLSLICIIMVLEFWDVTHIFKNTNLNYKGTGKIGALITGMFAGLVASPCSTPVLVIILAIAGTKNNIIYGIILLIYYSIGHNILTILTGISSKKVIALKNNKSYKILNNIITIVFGIIVLLMAFYFFYLGI